MSIDMKRIIEATDIAFAERIKNEAMCGCKEADHAAADDILCEMMQGLGYTKTVEAWKSVGKWYA